MRVARPSAAPIASRGFRQRLFEALCLLLVALSVAGNAEDAVPDTEFLEFLGGLEAEDEWEDFFDSVPDEMVERQASAETEDNEPE